MSERSRLDVAVCERGLAPSREKARALIMAGQVYVNDGKSTKSGQPVKPQDVIEVRGDQNPFVSRGGLKLLKAAEQFSIQLTGCVCLDIGASTGGFTDCMLSFGAKTVYAIDVGYGQLAWKLRTDERVVNMERTNFRHVTPGDIGEPADFASVDVSFISLKLILPGLKQLLKEDGYAVCLIKPQFEAGREKVGKKGVVRDAATHVEVINEVITVALDNGFGVLGLDFSPIKGPQGNIEYLMYIKKHASPTLSADITIDDLVARAHKELNGGESE